jgi:hypothetical protein
MSRRHRLLLGMGMMALLVVFAAGTALADEQTDTLPDHTLTAEGYGLVQFHGRGTVDISGQGASVVWVANGDTLEITGDGRREDLDGGVVKLVDWEGDIHVEGERFGVRMAGGHLQFTVLGRGRAFLQGQGTFQVDDHEGRWTWRGVHIPRRLLRPAVRERSRDLRDRSAPGG